MPNNKVKAIVLSAFDAATLTPAFQILNPGGLSEACFLIRITNDSTNLLIVSLNGNGINDNEAILPDTSYDFPTYKYSTGDSLWPKGLIIDVASTTAAAGSVYLSGYYV